ncbi:zinc-finger homeodomain protein 2-like isoform X1 [Primulina eburnea]|uniref:zinc-finger homeodomain protein 2-like isoform X1 n=1 Tax=Primulina eburnea TaxID=1245227 RepID=UPI003C6CC4D9
MERRDQRREKIPPPHNQESSMKLPLAHLVSTPSDRRRNATVSTHREISIFSPMQTLDQLGYEENPTQDLDPTTAKTVGMSSSKTPTPPLLRQDSPQQSPPAEASTPFNSATSITYRECLKNHAANTGNYAVDGCREFMPGGEEGTQESLKCAACDCHRNFHRKEVTSGLGPLHFLALPTLNSRQNSTTAAAFQLHLATTVASMPPTRVNYEGNSGGLGEAESSSEYLDMFQPIPGGYALIQHSSPGSKRRFRTKFTQEQKDRMHEFATKLGWSLQNEDDQEMQKFCREVGVKRRVFKQCRERRKSAASRNHRF